MSLPSRARDFPEGTPLNAFFAWNEGRLWRDRRHVVACDLAAMRRRFATAPDADALLVAHLTARPLIRWRWRRLMVTRDAAARAPTAPSDGPATAAALQLVRVLEAAAGNADTVAHAAVFQAFEALAAHVDLDALAGLRPRRRAAPRPPPRRAILVIKLSALGDFVQALGPAAALRRHHVADRITLLTTRPYAAFAAATGLFDEILVDTRPRPFAVGSWLALRRTLRNGRFHRVYDLQTSDRSSLYARLLWPGRPEWSGIAWRCSHPHANRRRDPQHTIDKQAEQLLMAGIHPVPLPALGGTAQALPEALAGRAYALLVPGSSPRHPAKRWPAERYGALARRLQADGLLPVVLGARGEEALAAAITSACPAALDLVARTDIGALADLARGATLTIGNDTGVTHIAAAAGNPVIVLFSNASEPRRCAPRGGIVRVLQKPDLAELAVETVHAEARALAGAEGDALRTGTSPN